MTISRLVSKQNPLLKTIRLVVAGSRRAPEDLVAAEGVRVLEEALRAGCKIESAVLSEHFGSAERERHLLKAWISQGIPVHTIDDRLFPSISGVQAPQGAIALIRAPKRSLAAIAPARDALILCACGIQDPGNLGTLIRTAAASGVSLVCTTPGTVSARNPKALRASAGAFFFLPLVEHAQLQDIVSYCGRHSIRVYRADPREGLPYSKADFRKPSALFLGNEGSGMEAEAAARLPAIHIPMAAGTESLNVAIAGAVILFEAFRQRGYRGRSPVSRA